MAKIKLNNTGFSLIPEGTTTFKIVRVEYKEDFGKMKIELQTKSGQKHFETYTLLNKAGEVNEKALNAFSYFAKTALNNFSVDEIDEQDLVGCYITATVTHEEFESNREAGKMLKSARLSDYAVSVGFGSGAKQTEESDDLEDEDIDLDELDDLD